MLRVHHIGVGAVATVVTALAALFPMATAHAQATVQTDRACYLETTTTTVGVRGMGFTAGAPFTVALDGQSVEGGSATIGGDGTMTGTLAPPILGASVHERTFTLDVATPSGQAQTQFAVTRFVASFWPRRGTAERLRVRFAVFGFGLAGPAQSVYLHYVSPRGRLARTVRLGRPTGACGSIPQTAQRRLFPFAATQAGKWTLQFDTRRRYQRGTSRSSFLYYSIKVRVAKRRAPR